MIKRRFVTLFAIALIVPMPAFAADYYFTVTGTAGGRSTAIWGPFASLSACQEAQAKALGRNRRSDVTISGCYSK